MALIELKLIRLELVLVVRLVVVEEVEVLGNFALSVRISLWYCLMSDSSSVILRLIAMALVVLVSKVLAVVVDVEPVVEVDVDVEVVVVVVDSPPRLTEGSIFFFSIFCIFRLATLRPSLGTAAIVVKVLVAGVPSNMSFL